MLKRILFAVVVMSFCSTSAFAQDQQVFVTFGEGADISATSEVDIRDVQSGSAWIYSAGDFKFNAFDLDFSTVNNEVIRFTGAEVFATTNGLGQVRWDGDDTTIRETVNDADGRLIGVAVLASGINPAIAAASLESADGFDASTGFFRVARIDYDIVGIGEADITLAVGANQFFDAVNPDDLISPTLGSGALTVVGVPEPSTVGLLALGLVGFVARRRR